MLDKLQCVTSRLGLQLGTSPIGSSSGTQASGSIAQTIQSASQHNIATTVPQANHSPSAAFIMSSIRHHNQHSSSSSPATS
jgi:hypothetical protein